VTPSAVSGVPRVLLRAEGAGLLTASAILYANFLVPLALIWIAHIGFDHLVGYGLKYAAGFGFTHLGHVGRAFGEASH